MATITASKPVDLNQLQAELIAAGIDASRGIASSGGDLDSNALKSLYTFDAQGAILDLPSSAAAVVTAHSSQTAAHEAADAADQATLDAFDTQLANFIALASPTAAQAIPVVQSMARAWRYFLRRGRRNKVL